MDSSDENLDPLCDTQGVDWTHKVYDWTDLLHGEARAENVTEFCNTLRKQKFVRILLPEEVIASYDQVTALSREFFSYDEDKQDESIEFSEMKMINNKLTGFCHQRFRQQYECRMTGAGDPVPCPYEPSELKQAICTHFDTMESSARMVLGLLSEGMGVNPKWFYDLLDPVEGANTDTPEDPYLRRRKLPNPSYTTANILRMMQYHSETEPEIEADGVGVLCADHLDVGFVTLSMISDNPCLQGLRPDGQWHDVEYTATGKRNEVLIWVGEQMEKVTNGYYKPLRHRVLQPRTQPPWMRVQNTFFLRGSPLAVVDATTSTRIPCKRPGLLRKFKTILVKQLMSVDAAKAILHDYLEDKRAQIKAHKEKVQAEEAAAAARSAVAVSTYVCESAVLNTSADSAWTVLRVLDFGFDPLITGGELVHGLNATQVGAVQCLHFKDGTQWTVQTTEISDRKRSVAFELLSRSDDVLVSSCQHRISLKPITLDNRALVEWSMDMSNDADAAVVLDAQFKRQASLVALQAYFAP